MVEVKYTKEEKLLVDGCFAFYKRNVYPDGPIDKNDSAVLIAALEYCHSRGELIRSPQAHGLMNGILSKNGVEVESNEHRQARLKKERMIAIQNKRMGGIQENVEIKKKELADAIAAANLEEKRIKDAMESEEIISTKEASAKKAQEVAEAKADKVETENKEMKDQMKAMQDQMKQMQALLQEKKNGEALKEVAVELAKGEKAELTKEPPAELTKEPEAKEEQTIEELIETLK